MKKQLVLVTGLAVLAAPAFASKARLQALGEDVNGSLYINDNRNIFLNASHVNEHKDLVTYEWGTQGTAAADDSAATPRSEAGFFFANGNMVYGAQLGNASDTAHAFRLQGMGGDVLAETNGVQLFVGGDAGVKWGASLFNSKSEDKGATADEKQESMRLQLGASQGAWEAFANVSLKNQAESNNQEFKGDTGYTLGGTYLLNDYKLFATYTSFAGEDKDAGDDLSLKNITLGAGRTMKLNDKASLFVKAQYAMTTVENDGGTDANDTDDSLTDFDAKEAKSTTLPVTVGLEYDAASWLTLRGSVGQNIMGEIEEKDKRTVVDSTVVNAGASLKFGDLTVDGVVGNDTNGDGTVGENTGSGNGVIRTDSLMSRVSMTYKF